MNNNIVLSNIFYFLKIIKESLMNNLVPVILCGGTGSRLWPLSRKSFPKQFLSLDNTDKKSLLQKTLN